MSIGQVRRLPPSEHLHMAVRWESELTTLKTQLNQINKNEDAKILSTLQDIESLLPRSATYFAA